MNNSDSWSRFNGSEKLREICAATPLAILALAFIACSVEGRTPIAPASNFRLQTSAVKQGQSIPAKFTCSGKDISPGLTWTDPPPATKSLALIMDDPDAPGGTFTHWIIINMSVDARELPEGANKGGGNAHGPHGGTEGSNDFGRVGYNGPCPPPGTPHRYFFRLYALDSQLNLAHAGTGITRQDVDRALKGHVLAEADVMGKFQRR